MTSLRGRRIVGGGLLLLLSAVVVNIPMLTAHAEVPVVSGIPPKKVVIVSVRNAAWDDVSRAEFPKLFALLDSVSVGSMSLQSARRGRPTAADMFVTLGAGTRSVTARGDGGCRQVSAVTIECATAAAVIGRNHDALYGSKPFTLGTVLSQHGIDRHFVGECSSGCVAALSLADVDGQLATSGRNFESALRRSTADQRSSVMLADFASPAALERALTDDARTRLQAADLLVLVSPAVAGGAPSLSMFALGSALNRGSFVASPTTRREGLVQMIDVAPTVLAALNIDAPEPMEGRRIHDGESFGSIQRALSELRAVNRQSRQRDRMIGGGVATLATLEILLSALLMLVVVSRKYLSTLVAGHRRVLDGSLQHISIVAFAYIPATLMINLFPLDRGGHWLFWSTLAAATFVLAAISWLPIAGKRRPLIAISCITAAVLILDGITGTHLSYNSIFGFSATAGNRFAGYGNSTFAFLAASCFVVAAVIDRRWLVMAGLGAVGLLVVLPPFGSDIGGAITMAAATVAFIVVRYGVALISRTGLSMIGGIAFVGAAIGIVDARRPSASQTHLGRFIDSVSAQGGSNFSLMLHRKWIAAQHELLHSVATFTVPIVAALIVDAWLCVAPDTRGRLTTVVARKATAISIGVVAVVGSLINDSGIKVAMAAFGVAVPALVWLFVPAVAVNPSEVVQ